MCSFANGLIDGRHPKRKQSSEMQHVVLKNPVLTQNFGCFGVLTHTLDSVMSFVKDRGESEHCGGKLHLDLEAMN